MGKNYDITVFESPNSQENPTHSLQFYFLSIPQSHAHRKDWECFPMGGSCQGREGALPVRSEGTRYFLLSRSGTLALGAFSTITWEEKQKVGIKTAESNLVFSPLHPTVALSEVSLSRADTAFPFLIPPSPLQNVWGNGLS